MRLTRLLTIGLLLATGHALAETVPVPGGEAPVTVLGYSDHAMEPFVTRDGRYLLFNNRNEPANETDLHIAEEVDPLTFRYLGRIDGANTPDLDGVPSVDDGGWLYWTATHRYFQTASVIHRARLQGARATGRELVPGLAREIGWIQFDSEISPDGRRLYLAEGWFGGGTVDKADLHVARRDGAGFRIDRADATMAAVNTDAEEFAPAISRDGLTLYFTRWRIGSDLPSIWRARRDDADAPFRPAERLPIEGFVEAPALSPDGRILYFHRLTDGRYTIHLHVLEDDR
jgi:hypothetical protein